VREYSGDVDAASALDVHKERVRGLNETLKLVLLLLLGARWVQQILGHFLFLVNCDWWSSENGTKTVYGGKKRIRDGQKGSSEYKSR